MKEVLAPFRADYIKLVDDLHAETLITLQTIDNIIDVLNELLSLPNGLTTSIDGIQAGITNGEYLQLSPASVLLLYCRIPLYTKASRFSYVKALVCFPLLSGFTA